MELKEWRQQKGEIGREITLMTTILTLLAVYRTVSSSTTSLFSQPETPSSQAFCQEGGGASLDSYPI